MFEPFLKSFFVRTSDPTSIKLLKLDILTNLATDANISVILRELQTYISSSDKQFVRATIQAIGRCACSISEVTDSCLNGLISLLSNRDGKWTVFDFSIQIFTISSDAKTFYAFVNFSSDLYYALLVFIN